MGLRLGGFRWGLDTYPGVGWVWEGVGLGRAGPEAGAVPWWGAILTFHSRDAKKCEMLEALLAIVFSHLCYFHGCTLANEYL